MRGASRPVSSRSSFVFAVRSRRDVCLAFRVAHSFARLVSNHASLCVSSSQPKNCLPRGPGARKAHGPVQGGEPEPLPRLPFDRTHKVVFSCIVERPVYLSIKVERAERRAKKFEKRTPLGLACLLPGRPSQRQRASFENTARALRDSLERQMQFRSAVCVADSRVSLQRRGFASFSSFESGSKLVPARREAEEDGVRRPVKNEMCDAADSQF